MTDNQLVTQELKPCPWCEKPVMHRHALHVSDGNTDDIIHAEPTDCGMEVFSIDTADRGVSVGKAWNTRLTHSPASDVGDSELASMMVDDPDWICAGIPDAVIEAGVDAWDTAREEMQIREQALDPENHTDWDEGMIVAAIFKAMLRAALTPTTLASADDGLCARTLEEAAKAWSDFEEICGLIVQDWHSARPKVSMAEIICKHLGGTVIPEPKPEGEG